MHGLMKITWMTYTVNREVEQTKLVRVRVRVRQKVVYDVITFCVPRTCATRYTYGKTCKAPSTRLRLLVDFIRNRMQIAYENLYSIYSGR